MKRPNQLVIESAVIVSVMLMLTLGGSVATTMVPGSFLPLQNPGNVNPQYDLSGLARYYNTTLTQIGTQNFANGSFLLDSFRFVNIPSTVNATAQAADADLVSLNVTIPRALMLLSSASLAIKANQLINATTLAEKGCSFVVEANKSMADFTGPQTTKFQAESVPTYLYAAGGGLVSSEIVTLHEECTSITAQIPGTNGTTITPVLAIGSTQHAIETGGPVTLLGNLTESGVGIAEQKVLFYVNGSYFGTLTSNSVGRLTGTLDIPFVYFHTAEVQALVAPNATIGIGGAHSNVVDFSILFNETSIAIGDPPSYLPGAGFSVHGNLTTTNGIPLPDAPVTVTFLRDSVATTTDSIGAFGAQFTVPNNATDGDYFVYARFTPRGIYGPSFNFTSIGVYHLRLDLALSAPSLSWAGFSTNVGGTATSKGNAVADANITLNSPWGSSTTKTDGAGHFDISFPVSPLEFGFSKNVTVSASPSEPYIAGSTVVATLGLFNVLLVILPAAVIGIGVYEANSLGVFQGVKARVEARRERESALMVTAERPSPATPPSYDKWPEVLRIYGRALVIASTRFSIVFKRSHTIREMLTLVKAKDDGEAFMAFSRILLVAEDFLYGRRFDPSRTSEVRQALNSLEILWS